MANTTFNGPVRSENGFQVVNKSETTGAFTVSLDVAGDGKIALTYSSASTNGSTSVEPIVMNNTMTGAGGVGGRAKFKMETNVALGSWSNALKGEVVYGATGRTAGLGSAIVAEMTLSAGTSSGTYAPLEIELNAPTNAVTGTLTSFIHLSTQGAAVGVVDDNAVLFNLQGVTSGSGHIWKTGTNLGTAAGGIRVRIGTTNYWLPVYAAQPT